MSTVLTIRANEIASLRDTKRQLLRKVADMEAIAHENDIAVAMMHRIALLLIAREFDWRKKTEKILQLGMKAVGAHIYTQHAGELAAAISRLPAGGRADTAPLHDGVKRGALYYHLPLKSGRRIAGLLTLTLKNKQDLLEGDDEFCRRLASLLTSALMADSAR